jgi:hypothetical protein
MQCVTTQPGREKLTTFKCKKIESILLKWFRQKGLLFIPIQDPVLRQKAEEIALKLDLEFTPLNGWFD